MCHFQNVNKKAPFILISWIQGIFSLFFPCPKPVHCNPVSKSSLSFASYFSTAKQTRRMPQLLMTQYLFFKNRLYGPLKSWKCSNAPLQPKLDNGYSTILPGTKRKYLSQAIDQYTDDGVLSCLNYYRVQHTKIILPDASNKFVITTGE